MQNRDIGVGVLLLVVTGMPLLADFLEKHQPNQQVPAPDVKAGSTVGPQTTDVPKLSGKPAVTQPTTRPAQDLPPDGGQGDSTTGSHGNDPPPLSGKPAVTPPATRPVP